MVAYRLDCGVGEGGLDGIRGVEVCCVFVGNKRSQVSTIQQVDNEKSISRRNEEGGEEWQGVGMRMTDTTAEIDHCGSCKVQPTSTRI